MAIEDDLRLVIEQEAALVFERFDEDVAFELGGLIRQAGKVLNRGGITTGIYTFDRTLFYGATGGGTEFNRRWIERKLGLVKLMLKSSYRVVLERGDKPRIEPGWGIEPAEYAIAGGAFPITVKGIGVVGAAIASGLHERLDHEIVRASIAKLLGKGEDYLALPSA
jgi:uncharacterized protein (UPF0303 family)